LDWVEGGLFQAVWKGVVLAAFMLAFVFIYQRYSFLVFQAPYNSTSRHFLEQKVFNAVLGVTIFTALLNALGEEIIFRGMLMPALSPYMGVASILILQSLIFTVYHFFAFQNAVLLFIMGIFFGLGYIWSGSLLTPVLAHLIENGLPSLVFLVRL
jgi:membrane protease YdiL (CAAX protease family)